MCQPESSRIMVVDDERCIADTLAAIFQGSGYTATAYYDGKSAFDACIASAPHFLITDVSMPGMSGLELAILMRQQCPSCKILLFSGLSVSFDLVEGAKQDGHHFEILEKPIAPALLLKMVAAGLSSQSRLKLVKPDAKIA